MRMPSTASKPLPTHAPTTEVTTAGGIATDHELTVIIPAFNEEKRLPWTLSHLGTFLDHWGVDYRVVVADDGSTDCTPRLANSLGPRFSTLQLAENRGKGCAVRTAMLRATGRVIAFTDADLPYDLSSLREGYDAIKSGACEVVFGARDMKQSVHSASRRLARTVATAGFRTVVKYLISREVTDTQCGLKLFGPRAAREIFSRTTIDGFAFDAEVVFLTRRLRLPYCRIPVNLINEYASTLSLRRHALPMLLDVIRLRWRDWLAGKPAMTLAPLETIASPTQAEQRKLAA